MNLEIDNYILGFPKEVQTILNLLRKTIRDAAPDATERISYAMPTFYLKGNLVHFAAYKEEISSYKNSKGAVQFPLNKPLPLDLITKIVKFRVEENLSKS